MAVRARGDWSFGRPPYQSTYTRYAASLDSAPPHQASSIKRHPSSTFKHPSMTVTKGAATWEQPRDSTKCVELEVGVPATAPHHVSSDATSRNACAYWPWRPRAPRRSHNHERRSPECEFIL
eukprot:4039583-Prymnesium_polylepis.1